MDYAADRISLVRENLAKAARVAGRQPGDIELVAVSKTHDPENIRAVAEAGQTVFGESRVQEAKAKISLLPGRLRWHFIGHLQKNKIRIALPLFELFHGVDSLEAAQQFQRIAEEDGLRPKVLLEINVAGESTKYGFTPEAIRVQIEEIMEMSRLDVLGLMGMAPFDPEPEHSRRYFQQLRELRDRLEKDAGIGLPQLSMGMSGDYLVAVEEGATIVRVGTAIFGARSGKAWKPTEGEI